ncbi:MAG: hypothetical protein IH865_08010 [Chloroflexi bacterium]|nr:hypothetical protein [Chloroflexota bacterium]
MTESISRLDRELAYIGFALLALPLLFVLHMTATYNVGLAYPLQSLVDAGFSSRPFELAGVLLLLGAPLLAAGVNLLALLRVRFDRKDGELVSTIRLRPNAWNLTVVAATAALYATLMLYLLTENWSCLTGVQAFC